MTDTMTPEQDQDTQNTMIVGVPVQTDNPRPEPNWKELNFPVSLRNLAAQVPGVDDEDEVAGSSLLLPDNRVVFREDTRESLAIVSSKYNLVPHSDIFEPLQEAVTQLQLPVQRVQTFTGKSGGYAKVSWILDEQKDVQAVGDLVRIVLTAKNSLDHSSRLGLELGAERLICTNGLTAPAGRAYHKSWQHRGSLSVEKAVKFFHGLLENAPQMVETWEEWAQIEYLPVQLEEHLAERSGGLYGKKARNEVVDYFEAQAEETLWEAYNALTWYNTHQMRSRLADQVAVRNDYLQDYAVKFATAVAKTASKN